MSTYKDTDKIISHLNDEIEACGNPDVENEPIAYGTMLGLLSAKSFIETAEIADVREVRHGKWISNELGGYKWAYYCSECDWVDGYPFNNRHKYCPNCGAKMDGKEQAMSKEKQNDPTDAELAEAAEDAYNNIIHSLIEATADRNDLVRKLRDAYKMILDLLKGAEISAMYTHVSVLLNKLNEEYSDVL